MNKNLVIDGNYLIFQSFYASYRGDTSAILRSSNGFPTNAIQLFLMQMIKLIRYIKPTHLFIAFDAPGKTKRHLEYQEYKSGRARSPDELYLQVEKIKQILTELNISWKQQRGDEADDLIATYVKKLPGEKFVFSADKDLLQLVDSKTTILQRKKDDYLHITLDNFYDLFSMQPNQITSYKGLKGDSSDNLPGIKGIGDKTAIKLLEDFGNFENIHTNIANSNYSKGIKEKILSGYQVGKMCFELSKLNTNVFDFDTNADSYLIKLNLNNANKTLEELQMHTVIKWLKKLILKK
ncbi:DNA polymerase-1 [Mycoplasmopsis mustelae]|uniref:5'-3' exonuclease n=1 Tax=Mycoplasmopsis mustelae TaxID=171289 RepID=A0A4R7UDQ3_9BACT|nr:5'-3' exonuclease [Mycoplasmopsis mustelae]TDV23272.1 DNA polymerase-1 [Mycoplasmopsis mustelae]